ncbi:serine hydrolase domain-containing protein [Dactylosporangium sp. CS-047395]|uniref:serine hydrolase domain-containing protein n=1 Tax=Dactylosporangium sp. CS-047395 TaxID=3239936 RepID=UPI003D8B1E59
MIEFLAPYVDRGELPGAVAVVDRGGRTEVAAVGSAVLPGAVAVVDRGGRTEVAAVGSAVLPGAVAVVDRGGRTEVAAVGSAVLPGAAMTPDSIFRIASATKPITAATLLTLVDDGAVQLDAPARQWLPELAAPMVARTPDTLDLVPATRPITVHDLLNSTTGWGFPSDFELPAVQALFPVQPDGRRVRAFPPRDEWLRRLAGVPMLHQPGQAWLYDTSSTLQGALIERVTGRTLGEVMAERFFGPLGMRDAAFHVPAASLDRFTACYQLGSAGLELYDAPAGDFAAPPAFELGNGGLVMTAGDWAAFGRMLLAGGVAPDGRRLLSEASVRAMLTDQTTAEQRASGLLFFEEGQGWSFGGSVDLASSPLGLVPGRYGWVGGTGTSAFVTPSSDTVAVLFTQVAMAGPGTPAWMYDFWRYVAS